MAYVDESVLGAILGGILVLLGVLWALWAAAWVRRVELRAAAEPLVREFGLAWAAEGLGRQVRARGTLGAREVELRVYLPADLPRYRARFRGERWFELDRVQPARTLRDRLGA